MPGAVGHRALKGVSIGTFLHMTLQSVGSLEIPRVVGAKVRSAFSNIFSAQGHVAVGNAKVGTATVLAWRGGSFGASCGRMTPLIHKETELEAAFTEDGTVPDPRYTRT